MYTIHFCEVMYDMVDEICVKMKVIKLLNEMFYNGLTLKLMILQCNEVAFQDVEQVVYWNNLAGWHSNCYTVLTPKCSVQEFKCGQ